ncbi:MAG: O-antigen ligase family protein [Alphaproteobacteria bacterium]|nr:O-antigen ligase family protein [Alphaproteobacteria bacterium]
MKLVRLREHATLIIVSLYLILNYGFMLIRMPPNVGVPFGELLLATYLLWLADVRYLPRFSKALFLFPFLLWWTSGIGRAYFAFPEHGLLALRDATHVIESLFIWVGFIFATKEENVERFFRWLPWLLVIGSIYAFGFPFQSILENYSPTVRSTAGESTAIFFQYTNTAVLVLVAAAYLMIVRPKTIGLGPLLLAPLLLAYVVAIFQARTIYLQVIAMLLLFAWQYRSSFVKMSTSLMLGALAFMAVSAFGIQLTGRLGGEISLDFVLKHFATIMGEGQGEFEGVAAGVDMRTAWWLSIWNQVTSSIGSLLFGLGYGFPLIDFTSVGGIPVREPHNSYISIFGRSGIIGLFAFVWMHIILLVVWFRTFRLCRRAKYRVGQERLLVLYVYILMIWINGIGEDAFEKPFNTFPYYIFRGLILHYSLHLRAKLKVPSPVRRSLRSVLREQFHAHPSRS